MHFSEDPLKLQYQGFLNTPHLWSGIGYLGLQQFPDDPDFLLPEFPSEELAIPDTMVLGRRVEYFYAHYLDHYCSETILAANLVVTSEKRTLGELDFLLLNRITGNRTHLELVYKFYLYDPSFEEEKDRWIGPNRADTLVKKLERLKGHQFPLLHRPETQDLLLNMGIFAKEFDQQVCFKASLFVPLEILDQRLPGINNACIKGYWIRRGEFTKKNYGAFEFHTPTKWNWPIDPSTCRSWCTFDEIFPLILHLNRLNKTPLVWMKTPLGEYLRFFVVWW